MSARPRPRASVTSAGMTARASAAARRAEHVRALPPTGRPATPVVVSRTARANSIPAAEATEQPCSAAGPGEVGRLSGERPIIRRRAGRRRRGTRRRTLTGLPGRVNTGTLSSPSTPKPCGMPGRIATLSNSHGPSRDSDLLDGVEGAHRHPAGRDDRVGAAELALERCTAAAAASSSTSPTRNGVAPTAPRRRPQHAPSWSRRSGRARGAADLDELVAGREDDHARPRRTTRARAMPGRRQQGDLPGPEQRAAVAARRCPASTSSPRPHGRASRHAGSPDLHPHGPAVGRLDRARPRRRRAASARRS